MRENFQERTHGSHRRRQFELSHWSNVTFTQGIEPAVGITDYRMDVVIMELDDLSRDVSDGDAGLGRETRRTLKAFIGLDI